MKKHSFLFLLLCLALCLAPLAGMLVYPTTVSTDNRPLTAFPSPTDRDGGANLAFFQQAEASFNDHFAFRNELIYADALLQSRLFGMSSVENVIVGREGWLYYASTLDDYLGLKPMSARELNNLAHNLSLVARYVEARGADFLFCVPPNKNTLYGAWMPDWAAGIVESEHNMERLAPLLREAGVPYADLLALFRAQDEILYLKRDSHWSNKGAALAASYLLDSLGCPHEDYAALPVVRVKDDDGDLNRMLYTLYGERSVNYRYELPQRYHYVGDGVTVQDGQIDTEGGRAGASLLMFRDSFGDTLIPLLANEFSRARFSKEVPYALESGMDRLSPAYVIVEKVERNLREYLTMPPILSAPKTEADLSAAEPVEAEAAMQLAPCEYDSAYLSLSGELDGALLGEKTGILLRVGDTVYEAYHTGENGFLLYLKADALRLPVRVQILLCDGGSLRALPEQEVGA